jgi:16S rRNA (guanine527-N7)-methyltransferase
LSKEAVAKLFALTERLIEENEKYNLTAITEPDKVIVHHYLDSAMLSSHLPKGATVIDVGCGAGFPTLPLAILRPDLKITAVDSTAKRVNYVEESARLLGLDGVTAKVGRAEELGRDGTMREKFDFATARAVAEMRILAELCLPFVKVGGKFIAVKGKNAEFELQSAKKALAILGGRSPKTVEVTLKGGAEELSHPLIIVDKKERTPESYPRVYAQISKKPL